MIPKRIKKIAIKPKNAAVKEVLGFFIIKISNSLFLNLIPFKIFVFEST